MNQIATVNQNQIQFSDDQVSVIKNQIAIGATDLELKSFIWQCQRTGLDPFARQIYFMKSKKNNKVTIQTSIDGFRLIAERSGQYEGQTRPRWCAKDGNWKDIWTENFYPYACEVGVYKKGQREPTYGLAKWDEYAGNDPEFMWKKMPAHMLAKVAESLALRKAFPNEMSGLYSQEELAHAEPQKAVHPDQPSEEDHAHAKLVNGYTIPFGKFKCRSLEEVGPNELAGYVEYIEKKAQKDNKPIQGMVKEFIDRACEFIAAYENSDPYSANNGQDVPI